MKLKFLVVFLALLVIPAVALAAENCTKESGRDYAEAGTAILGTDEYPDICVDEVTLLEYFCDDKALVEYEYYTCPDACFEGACSGVPSGNQTGNDSVPGCVEDWGCTEWSACVNNQQTRTCTDANACNTVLTKPVESQSCTPITPPTTTTGGLVKYRYYIIGGVVLLLIILYFVFRKNEPEMPASQPKSEEKK